MISRRHRFVLALALLVPLTVTWAQHVVLNDGPADASTGGAWSGATLLGSVDGTTLQVSGSYNVASGTTLTFGDATHRGTVLLNGTGGLVGTQPRPTIAIAAGTVLLGSNVYAGAPLSSASSITVHSEGTLDVATTGVLARNVQGSGRIVLGAFDPEPWNSLEVRAGNFSGVISGDGGAVDKTTSGALTLSGDNAARRAGPGRRFWAGGHRGAEPVPARVRVEERRGDLHALSLARFSSGAAVLGAAEITSLARSHLQVTLVAIRPESLRALRASAAPPMLASLPASRPQDVPPRCERGSAEAGWFQPCASGLSRG